MHNQRNKYKRLHAKNTSRLKKTTSLTGNHFKKRLIPVILTLILALTGLGLDSTGHLPDFVRYLEAVFLEDVVSGEARSDFDYDESTVFDGYTWLEVEGGDLSGHREANVVVNIGFGDREYYAFTNDYGQLVRVIAKEIILQDDFNEPVLASGRYYYDEAKVPGTERKDLDEGHVIADSLGGVANAYNITPQNSTLNRHGDQAYMEKVIRDAGGCSDFVALIYYPDTKTQIPSRYRFKYTVKGNTVYDAFNNADPEVSQN